MTIDKQVVDDVVGLIEAEMGEVASGDHVNSPERLASVILGRLGYEVEEPSPFPDITPGEWFLRGDHCFGCRITDCCGETIAQTHKCSADARLIAAAPKLMSALYEIYQEVLKESRIRAVVWKDNLDKSEAALRDAGVEL